MLANSHPVYQSSSRHTVLCVHSLHVYKKMRCHQASISPRHSPGPSFHTLLLSRVHGYKWKAPHNLSQLLKQEICNHYTIYQGIPDGASGKEPACRCKRHKRHRFNSWGQEGPLEKEMATHPSILAWRIPQTREAWQATVHGITKSRTWLQWLSTHIQLITQPSLSCRKTLDLWGGGKKDHTWDC